MLKNYIYGSSMARLATFFVFLLSMTACKKNPELLPLTLYPGYHLQPVGTAARDLLRAETFTLLTIEIQYMQGFRPEKETLEHLKKFLQRYITKPDGITFILSEIKPTQKNSLRIADIRKVEKRQRKLHPMNNRLAVYVLITDGVHPDDNFLGMAYSNTSAVLFGDAIQRHSGTGKILTKTELETAVLLHEMGHLLGLGISSNTTTARGANKGHGHCENDLCLMYANTETSNLSLINRKGRIPKLGERCRRLLQVYNNKTPSKEPVADFYFSYFYLTR